MSTAPADFEKVQWEDFEGWASPVPTATSRLELPESTLEISGYKFKAIRYLKANEWSWFVDTPAGQISGSGTDRDDAKRCAVNALIAHLGEVAAQLRRLSTPAATFAGPKGEP